METLDCSIRKATEQDLSQVYAVELEVFGSNAYPYWYIRFLYALSPDMFLVMQCNSMIAGYVVGLIHKSFCHLVSIAVRASMQGRGIGSRLLSVFEKECYRRGRSVIILEVESTNHNATRFYLRRGFRPLRIIPNYYGVGRHAILMVKVVNNQL